MKTNIQVSTETRDRLFALRGKGETYEDVVKKLLDEAVQVKALLMETPEKGWSGPLSGVRD